MLFSRECTDCGERMLIFPSQITAISKHGGAVEVTYECWCGAEQTCGMDGKGNLARAA